MNDSIILYSSPTCPICKMIKMQLQAKGITFQETHDTDELASKGYRGLPVLFVDGKFLTAPEIKEWLHTK